MYRDQRVYIGRAAPRRLDFYLVVIGSIAMIEYAEKRESTKTGIDYLPTTKLFPSVFPRISQAFSSSITSQFSTQVAFFWKKSNWNNYWVSFFSGVRMGV